MTIRSITPIALDLPFEVGGPKSQFAGRPRQMAMLLVRVETEDGIVGWGDAFGYAVWPVTRTAIETLIAPMAVGKDEDDIDALMHVAVRYSRQPPETTAIIPPAPMRKSTR